MRHAIRQYGIWIKTKKQIIIIILPSPAARAAFMSGAWPWREREGGGERLFWLGILL
jgi:hypothetical protein